MSNPYDQFDALPLPAAGPNPYDQFDTPTVGAAAFPLRIDSFGGILIDGPPPSPRPLITDSFGGVLVEDWPGSPAADQRPLQPPFVNAPEPGIHPAPRRFTPEQYEAFATLSGLGPAMAAGSLHRDITATDAAMPPNSESPGYPALPSRDGRPPQGGYPLALGIAPTDAPRLNGSDSLMPTNDALRLAGFGIPTKHRPFDPEQPEPRDFFVGPHIDDASPPSI